MGERDFRQIRVVQHLRIQGRLQPAGIVHADQPELKLALQIRHHALSLIAERRHAVPHAPADLGAQAVRALQDRAAGTFEQNVEQDPEQNAQTDERQKENLVQR